MNNFEDLTEGRNLFCGVLDVYKRQRGDSATGKTTLIEMIQDHENDPLGSPVELISDKKCYVLEGCLLYTSRCV